ncbi:hypothetical protein MNV_1300016 [Candidatus Methanoperedens nitroreducens]|uniref:Uncharacterized protein n=1 Tax=Candidatus Methanoperedens nitratireducens TaxID=1392998 RepID=A0A284VKE5_9EURY|nr:hypothetical protein MNV_1300016 [Candidatus Methanoperedens nitroreducens]
MSHLVSILVLVDAPLEFAHIFAYLGQNTLYYGLIFVFKILVAKLLVGL